MKRTIILAFLVSLLVLNGCQQPSEKVLRYQENYEIIGAERDEIVGKISDTIYDSIDRSNKEAKEVIISPIPQEGEDITLPEGRYLIGGDISGNIYVHDEHGDVLIHEVLNNGGNITVDVSSSHTIHVDGFESVYIYPEATQLLNELGRGIWEVGKDIEAGEYNLTGSGFSFGYLQIFEQGQPTRVFEVFPKNNPEDERTINVQLKDGQKLKVTDGVLLYFELKS